MHEKLTQSINTMVFHWPYYAEVLLGCIFVENNGIPTAGVRATRKGFEYAYNKEFIDGLTQEQVNYLNIHECQHILASHGQRAKDAQLNHSLSNIAADMVINTNIEFYADKEGKTNLIDRPSIPDDPINPTTGKKDILLIPDKYKDEPIMEYLYNWLIENDQTMEDSEGNYTFRNGGNFDEHFDDEVSPDMRNEMVKEIIDTIRRRGLGTADFEQQLLELRRSSTNYLNKIKAAIAQALGHSKVSTWFKPSRRNEFSKGVKKSKDMINVILDTSGSMGGTFEHVLSYIFHNGIEINLIQCDTEIKSVDRVKSKNQLRQMKIKGLGGTEMSKAVEYIIKNCNRYPTIFLTDGIVGSMNLTGIQKDFMILYTDDKVHLTGGKAKQFKIPRKS